LRLKLPRLLFCLLLFWMNSACSLLEKPLATGPDEPDHLTNGDYTVYFSNPSDPQAGTYRGGPDEELAKAIDQSRLSVDVAAHQLNLWSIRDALLSAHRRGVKVRLVVESDYLDEREIQQLKEAGIPILGDRRESLMHNKFTVLDRVEVWTGSMNFTTSDVYRNDNNLVRIRSTKLAENYSAEFDEMFEQDLFGMDILAKTPHPTMITGDMRLEVYFSPDDNTAGEIIRHIQSAQESVYFLAFSFTSDEIADAILDKANEGVRVIGVLEASQVISNTGSDYELFRENGLDVLLDGNPRNMHHKIIILDEATVITGSYNFSANAEKRNDENTLVIQNPEIVSQFLGEFERVYSIAQTEEIGGKTQ
jgi:phosphatidylserine/phosphatidylglycerophosphate/cardiolipin synthase-like enzyme